VENHSFAEICALLTLIEDWKPQLAFHKVEQESENYLSLKQSIMVDNNPDNNFPKLKKRIKMLILLIWIFSKRK
jgi:hypothetical protein